MPTINTILEKKVFLVRNPHRKKKTDQYNVRVLQIDDVLLLMQLAKKEISKEYLRYLDKLYKEQKITNEKNIVSTIYHTFKNNFKAFSKTQAPRKSQLNGVRQ